MDEGSSFRGLVESLVQGGLIADDLDKLLALEDLLHAAIAERWPRSQVAAAVASLYATTPDSWERVDRHVRYFLGDPKALPSVGLSHEGTEATAHADVYLGLRSNQRQPFQARLRASMRNAAERVLRRMARMSVGSWTGLLAMGLVSSGAVGLLLLDQGTSLVEQTFSVPDEAGPRGQPDDLVPEVDANFPEVKQEPSVTIRPDGSHRIEVPMDAPLPEANPEDDLEHLVLPDSYLLPSGLLLFSILFAALGLMWLRTPGAYRDRVRDQRKEAKVLKRELKESRGKKVAPYLVERFEPFGISNAAGWMDDIATILGRIGSEVPGETLDVEETLDGTVRAGGIPTPAMEPSHAPRELLVLVDIEKGDHPYLHGVQWVLERWRRGGLAFVRYNFSNRPSDSLERCSTSRPNGGKRGRPVALETVARRTQGMPLIVFSRGTDLVVELRNDSQAVDAQWLQLARAWPERVFVDLDPRPLDERVQDARATLQKLQQHKFQCVPFSPSGLEAAALFLAGRKGAVPTYAPLKKLAEVKCAVERWLAAVAVVPDPTWVQMEAFRREFLSEELPDPRYLERALEWVQQAFEDKGVVSNGTKDNGVRLALDTFADDLLVEQILRDKQRLKSETLVNQARVLLLKQLRGAAPARDNPAYKMWSLKVAYQEAMLEPARADELLGVYLGSEVEAEALDMVDGAVEREKKLRDSGALGQPLAPQVKSYGGGGSRVPVGWLHPFRQGAVPWEFWLVAVGCAIGAVGGMHVLARPGPQEQEVGTNELAGVIPADIEVELLEEGDVLSKGVGNCDFSGPPIRPAKPNPDIAAAPTGRSCGVVETALADTDAPMNLIGLTGGAFTMGSPESESGHEKDESPQHRVALSRFAICETEVSVRQYELVTGEKPSNCEYGCDNDHPVQNVSWEDSVKFLNALTRRENERRGAGLTACYDEETWAWEAGCTGYRLPTEAEWEFAARAGSTTAFHFGDDETKICEYANTSGSGVDCDDGFGRLAPVKFEGLKPNAWGLHEVHGNVLEWTYDWYDSSFYEESQNENPANKNTARSRVLRGGSFDWPSSARSALRSWDSPVNRFGNYGLRCVRGPSPQH